MLLNVSGQITSEIVTEYNSNGVYANISAELVIYLFTRFGAS